MYPTWPINAVKKQNWKIRLPGLFRATSVVSGSWKLQKWSHQGFYFSLQSKTSFFGKSFFSENRPWLPVGDLVICFAVVINVKIDIKVAFLSPHSCSIKILQRSSMFAASAACCSCYIRCCQCCLWCCCCQCCLCCSQCCCQCCCQCCLCCR